ncbi:reverse transcriptase [Pyricularia oryzae]|nr:reverse transcriptase [Pyricularia oryzae]
MWSPTLAPVKSLNYPCGYCGSRTNTGHEDVCKGALRKSTARHDQIKRAFIRSLSSRPELNVETEPDLRQNNLNVNVNNNVNNANDQRNDNDVNPTVNPNNERNDVTPISNGPAGPGSLITTPILSGIRRDPNGLRADFAVINGISKYYYDVQIVAINKDSANADPFVTLTEAANEKRRKYPFLDPFFHPIIISAGGLMEKSTAQAYKQLQKLIGPVASHWLDTSISLALLRSRTTAAISITKDLPRRN